MNEFEERSTRIYSQKQMFNKQELEARENVCIRDEPAFCSAACPLKLDAKAFVKAIKTGDFSGARAVLEKAAPFPLILAHGCEAPCEKACRLAEKGEGVRIGALERACMTLGSEKAGRGLLKFKKKKTVAIFGADLFSLALAGELANKAYPVTFYCAEENASAVVEKCAPFLSAADNASEAERFLNYDILKEYQTALSPALFAEKRADFDIVCAAYDFALSISTQEKADDLTLVYPGCGLVAPAHGANGVLDSLYDAKRAALSVDRLAQGIDPASGRGTEGAVKSRLYTNMSGVKFSKQVPEVEMYSAGQALEEASRCIECSCEECAKGCAYLRHYKKFPRQLTREIYNNVSIIMGDHMMNRPINSCALCRQCTFTCPFGYEMADVCHTARQNMVTTGKMPLAPHEFALHDMLFSNGEAFLSRPQPGYDTCRYVFFPGCQAGAVAPETVERAYKDLCARLSGGVAIMLGCCGAIADWAGRYVMFGETAEFIANELAKLGNPRIIAGCPTCKKTLKESAGEEILGIWDVLNEIGLPEGAAKEKRAVAMHDSCGARGDLKTQEAVRTLAKKLGCGLIETPYSGDRSPCCGYGGLVSYANREVAHELAQSCVSGSDAPYITYCMACRDRFLREGHESMHILELVYGPLAKTPPDISEKRRNRLSLKNRLLLEMWGENVMEKNCGFPLEITAEARAQMDDRMILETDVLAVMNAYRESGDAIFDEEANLLIARRRVGNVTFWVKFEEIDGGYVVRGAYSHRMTVK